VEIGPISFQPSEVMKLAIILYLAAWFSERGKKWNADTFEGLVPFLAVIGLVSFLIYQQPDAGTLGLIYLISIAMFFASGARLAHIFGLITAGLLGLAFLIKVAPYRLQRFLVFLNPDYDPLGHGYQLNQALYALGSGGILGLGLGQSRQKFNYLPEPVTDSIFAVLGEELGFIGTTLLITAFLLIAWRGLRIARRAPDEFGRLIAIGIVSWIFIQAFVNMAAISGAIPLTGIPLPFVSYGGTSLAVLLSGVGILLNISKQAKMKA
jgi:cell division protein FtsW